MRQRTAGELKQQIFRRSRAAEDAGDRLSQNRVGRGFQARCQKLVLRRSKFWIAADQHAQSGSAQWIRRVGIRNQPGELVFETRDRTCANYFHGTLPEAVAAVRQLRQ